MEAGIAEVKPFWNLTSEIIRAAFEVHKALGNGFLEKVYVRALLLEHAEQDLRHLKSPFPSITKATMLESIMPTLL